MDYSLLVGIHDIELERELQSEHVQKEETVVLTGASPPSTSAAVMAAMVAQLHQQQVLIGLGNKILEIIKIAAFYSALFG